MIEMVTALVVVSLIGWLVVNVWDVWDVALWATLVIGVCLLVVG